MQEEDQRNALSSKAIADSAVEHDTLRGHGPHCVEANWLQGCDRHIDFGSLTPDQPSCQLLSHGGRERDATAVATEIDQRARSGFMHVGVVIGGHGKAAIPAV